MTPPGKICFKFWVMVWRQEFVKFLSRFDNLEKLFNNEHYFILFAMARFFAALLGIIVVL